ncbi:MAG TPA: S41 family peptidase [Gemmataceae bacterium]|nr:S41 family peptidase [Gemmataceae bacterium]
MMLQKFRRAQAYFLGMVVLLAAGSFVHAASGPIKLARHPDYHNGKIVFSYLGNLWLVEEDGSPPRRLTVHRARDIHPRFSPDGKWIAFSSSRYGNYDVFIIPAEGGEAKRLTYHSAADTVVGWTRDSKYVLFSSARGLLYPGIPNLYQVPIDGGLEQPLPTDWGYWGSFSPDGKKFAFNRHPMVWSRKHYRGSYAADLWVAELPERSFRKLLDSNLPDDQKPNNFWPMYGNGEIYFVSDRNVMAKAGSPEAYQSCNNIWRISEDGGQPVQITHHTSGSLFWPSLSSDGRTIVYEENFGLWKLDLGSGKPVEVKISIASDDKENNLETLTINSEADGFHVSPSGKRAVISTHGELFTIATDQGDVRRLTQTPGVRETQPQWSPDGKRIAFVSDKSGREEVWVCDEEGGQLKQISDSDSQKGQLSWAPDSKAILYTGSDKKLFKYEFATNQTTVLARGDVIGFGGAALTNPRWSPDSKWVSYTKAGNNLLPHVYVLPAAGGEERRVTDELSYSDANALWTPDGKKLVYLAGSDVGNIGQAGRSTAQIYSLSLVAEEKDPRDKSIDSEQQAATERPRDRRRRSGTTSEKSTTEEAASSDTKSEGTVEVKIDFNHIGRRARQLTRTADAIGDLAVTPDSKSIVFTTTGTEGGRSVQSIWSMEVDGERLTRVTQSGQAADEEDAPRGAFGRFRGFTALQFPKEDRTLFYRQGNGIYTMSVGGGSGAAEGAAATSSPPFSRGAGRGMASGAGGGGSTARRVTFTARVEVDHRAERRQVFEESWRVMKHRFYAANMHGVDWQRMKAKYEPLLEFVGDQEELHDVISQMIGELNASHTGISPGGRGREESGPQTRYPGFELQADPSGFYRVVHIYKNGPADKDYVKIHVGDYILAIDGQEIKAGDNYWKAYTLAPGTKLEFTVNGKPAKEGGWKTKVMPVSGTQYATLQYEKWVADRRAEVDKSSGGTVGYLHIRQMNEPALRKFERDLAELHNKKGLIIDQRFNPGGGIDQELLQILQQRQYQYTRVRDSVQVTRPLHGFFGPMVVMENERSTSDAEVFPDGFRTLKLGKIVGVTTYGAVIGTGAYQLMDGSSIRTPGSGLWNISGTNLENYGVPPDVYVDNTPDDFLKGRDAQLEKAVEVVLQQLKR